VQHKLNRKETRVVSQLVRDHLLMSVTAQRKDITDPDVVRDFTQRVGSMNMLNYLYLLTVADIRSTNPKLWNNWKNSLLMQLYRATKAVIRRGIDNAPDIDEIIQENRDAAFEEMADLPFSAEQINSVCDRVPGNYFLRHHPLEIKWHVGTILDNPEQTRLVRIRQSTYTRNTKVFIYGDEAAHTFSQVTGTLGALGLSIQNAEIFTTFDNKIMDTFTILDSNDAAVTDAPTIAQIEKRLLKALQSDSIYQGQYNTRKARQLKAFDHPTAVQFEQDYPNRRTVMEISTIDMPGLLSVIANVIAEKNIDITHAKISTLGEKINDIFYLTTPAGDAITEQVVLDSLAADLVQALEAKKAA
jgi:[protein-PII] uridylyltransferase